MIGFLQGRGRTVAFDRYLQSRERLRPGYLLSHFLSSHDVPGALHQLGGDRGRFRLAAVLQFTAIGLPLVYYGEEVARAGGDWPENRSDMPWAGRAIQPGAGLPRDEALRADYRRLIAIRRTHPALWRVRREPIRSEGDLLVFARYDETSDDSAIVAVNRGDAATAFEVSLPSAWRGRPVHDAWRDTPVVARDGVLNFPLADAIRDGLLHETAAPIVRVLSEMAARYPPFAIDAPFLTKDRPDDRVRNPRHAVAGSAADRLDRVGRHRSRRSRLARAVARSRVCRLAHPALIGEKATSQEDQAMYTRYDWTRGTELPDELNHARNVRLVDARLLEKGLARAEPGDSPDVLVAYHTSFDQNLRIDAFSTGWGPLGLGPDRSGSATVQKVLVGTPQRDKKLAKATEKMFRNYPPRS